MTTPTALKHTPLTALHEAAGARLVDFSGYLMPVQYDAIMEEVVRVRTKVGLFDLCHMGRCRITGTRAVEAAQFLVHVNVHTMKVGAIRYSFFAREDGTTMDDVLVYKEEDSVFFCINAGNRERDLVWMREVAARYDCEVEDLSEELAMIALQGPASLEVIAPLMGIDSTELNEMKYYSFRQGQVGGVPAMISRTGYTGEDGFEIYFDADMAEDLWQSILEAGESFGLTPIGLAARDTLRLEAGMALYGHELDDTTNPVEAGIVFRPIKHTHDFSGRAAIEAMLEAGPGRVLVGFTADGPRVPRQGYELVSLDHTPIGKIVSGSPSPTLNKNIGTAYVVSGHDAPGTRMAMEISGKRYEITLHALPFYKRPR